jgi:putative transcriptional regulator
MEIVKVQVPANLPEKACEIHVVRGGPVETSRGFVLHSALPDQDFGSVQVNDGVGLSANVEILRAIAKGEGPDHAFFALGYAGWAAGQLEAEIQGNGWILCPATQDLLFDEYFETKYERALESIGIDIAMLSTISGNA